MHDFLDRLSLALAWLKRGRRLRFDDAVLKVNLGSSLVVAPGWVNVDASWNALLAGAPRFLLRWAYRLSGTRHSITWHDYERILKEQRFVHCDVRHALPFADASVDYIYSSHLLEHLTRIDALKLLTEVRRVLKSGGVVRLCVPDLAHAVQLLVAGEKERGLEIFFTERHPGQLHRHRYLYDAELLEDALRRSGLVEVQARAFRQGEVPDLDLLDNRPEVTLYMEARAPRS